MSTRSGCGGPGEVPEDIEKIRQTSLATLETTHDLSEFHDWGGEIRIDMNIVDWLSCSSTPWQQEWLGWVFTKDGMQQLNTWMRMRDITEAGNNSVAARTWREVYDTPRWHVPTYITRPW